MVKIWYRDDSDEDQREEHQTIPPKFLNLQELHKVSGVKYWNIDVNNIEGEGKLKKIREEMGYDYADEVDLAPGKFPNYHKMQETFYTEHLHADNAMRLFLEGGGYLDVRDTDDKWIRIKAERGDLLALPAGIYHRFTLDKNNYAKVMRLFSADPVWTAIFRPADDHPARKLYLQNANSMFTSPCRRTS